MSRSPESATTVRAQSDNVSLWLALAGIVLVILGNAIDYTIWSISVGSQIANIGALLLITGVLQWFFDRKVRNSFFLEIKREIVGSSHLANSGISDCYSDSKNVDFTEHFISSKQVIVGVNYSAKLIDNSITLLKERVSRELHTKIAVVDPGSDAARFLAADYKLAEISHGINKIEQIVDDLDRNRTYIEIVKLKTILRYSFVSFDSRIWVVPGTNGLGRRAVPGFFVTCGGPWHNHFAEDIKLLLNRI